MDDEVLLEEVAELLPRIVRQWTATFTCYGEERGLPFAQMKALGYLYRQGRSTVGEVAEGLGLAMPTASELVDKLVERGLLERGVNPHDRRQVHVWLTEEAIAYGRDLLAMRRSQIRRVFDELEPSEREVLLRGLRALSEAICLPPSESKAPVKADLACAG
jgi:DNA-binding MarR family transcriptional regulator